LDRVFGSDTEGNLRERSSNEKKKDSGGLSAVAGVLVVLSRAAAVLKRYVADEAYGPLFVCRQQT
jgi:hypothetical protein